jgi:uncharacterized protein YbcV (DUF1398 family)
MSKLIKSIIQIFKENELKVSKLYNLYAQKLTDHKDFWKKIAKEEVDHAQTIGDIFPKGQKKDKYFQENNFTRGIVKYVTDFLDEQIKYVEEEKLTHVEAINIALRIEQSVLEKKYFEIFIPTDMTLKKVLEKLNRETLQHVSRLRKELKKQLNKENN